MKKKLVVFVSGTGTNLAALAQACQENIINADICLVICNKSNAKAIEVATQYQLEYKIIHEKNFSSQLEFENQLIDAVKKIEPNWIILAGWNRLLSSHFIDYFPFKIINIHPALPGTFPGLHAIERAWQAYQEKKIQHTGIMIHYVIDESIDAGPVIAKETITFREGEDLNAITERMHQVEWRLIITVLKELTVV